MDLSTLVFLYFNIWAMVRATYLNDVRGGMLNRNKQYTKSPLTINVKPKDDNVSLLS